ncbi:NYN domain-containing protein [Cobetia sp. 1AS1]|uniref:NYN domain-containing protein n=1 Tax=Cobetia sp. 1AS1 TaxID=3040016 RepID=UPI00244C31E7|nr:NYN domain-containing protein [Cobetia sp. 1AS1]MDH2293224.1 NYN domain-containing protein [Cobetia sp. 1AS1]
MPTAILVDCAYFIKRFRKIEPENAYNASRAADCLHRWAVSHLNERIHGQKSRKELYRIFVYDCPPLQKKAHNPITKRAIDFSKTDEAVFRNELHSSLKKKRKVALRLGNLSEDTQWTIKPHIIEKMLKGKYKLEELGPDDVKMSTRQKGVDMRIGVDVTSLTLKNQVDQIILFAGDADFVPVAKIARREGIDFILDPMRREIPAALDEHIDGLRSTCPQIATSKHS